MTTDYYHRLRDDLLLTYSADLCAESVQDIRQAPDLPALIALLHRYAAFSRYQSIPNIDWLRRWFSTPTLREEAAQHGCFIDRIATIDNPNIPIIAYGHSTIFCTFTKPTCYNLTLHDESECHLVAKGLCVVRVRKREHSQLHIIHKDTLSILRIHTT